MDGGRATLSRSKDSILADLPALATRLGRDPGGAVASLALELPQVEEERYDRLAELVRVALQRAWDRQPEQFFKLLSPWLKSDNPRLRRAAAGALPLSHEELRAKCVRHLKRLAGDPEPRVRRLAIDFLSEDPAEHTELVKRWAKDEDAAVRATVARNLANCDAAFALAKALPLLEILCQDPRPEVHWAAASTLLALYPLENRPVLDVARQMAGSQDEAVREAAAAGLFEQLFSEHFENLLPTIRAWLRQHDANLVWTLVRSLRFISISPRTLTLLRGLFESKDAEVRRRIGFVLLDHYDPLAEERRAIADILRRSRGDPSRRVREVLEEGEARFGIGFCDPEHLFQADALEDA